MQRISLVHQGFITTVDIHKATEDESVFDDNPNLALRIIRDENKDEVRITSPGADLKLSTADWFFLLEQVNSLVRSE